MSCQPKVRFQAGLHNFRQKTSYLWQVIVLIDNYDSFTYNLADVIARHVLVEVIRHDQISLQEVYNLNPEGIVISPGPGRPEESPLSCELIRTSEVPILGVCLGHQVIGHMLGGKIVKAAGPMHGITSDILHTGTSVFEGLPNPLRVMRYHSLVIEPASLPAELYVTAQTTSGEIMGVAHRSRPIAGVQFHPESILSEGGEKIVYNWLSQTDILSSNQLALPTEQS
ncbi:MAG: aminodeoxychorismate/anthranilate synthase component II [Bacteroidota bacterium]